MSEEMTLQITSMADIFTIILVFLLKSYSTNLTSLAPGLDVTLPVATGSPEIRDTLAMEVHSGGVLIDQKQISALKAFTFDVADLLPTGASDSISRALAEQRRMRPNPNIDSYLLLLADATMPFSALKVIINSAATAGFVDVQLVVVNND